MSRTICPPPWWALFISRWRMSSFFFMVVYVQDVPLWRDLIYFTSPSLMSIDEFYPLYYYSVARNILVHRVILGMYKSIWSEQVELLGQRICLNSDRRCQNAFLKGLCQFTLLKWLCENSSAYSLSNCVLSTRWIFANLIGENYL